MPPSLSPQLLDYAATVLTLVALEGLLSADNALALALLVRDLPEQQRGRALRYGLIGAFVFRAVGIALAVWLIRLWYLKTAGAAWLLFLSVRHFVGGSQAKRKGGLSGSYHAAAGDGFWRTVVSVELTDIAFSIDSILAAVALSSNIYVVYLGGILGIVAMRVVAGYFVKIIDRFPGLEVSAYLIIAWIGIKLGIESFTFNHGSGTEPEFIPKWLFWTVLAALFAGGMVFSRPARDPENAPE